MTGILVLVSMLVLLFLGWVFDDVVIYPRKKKKRSPDYSKLESSEAGHVRLKDEPAPRYVQFRCVNCGGSGFKFCRRCGNRTGAKDAG